MAANGVNEPIMTDADIIQNTGELKDVISELEALIKKIDEFKNKFGSAIDSTANGLSKLSSATKEGRDGISRVITTLSELSSAYKSLADYDATLTKNLLSLAKNMSALGEGAERAEEAMVSFGSVSEALEKGSLRQLEKYLKQLTNEYKKMNAEMRETKGVDLSKDIKTLTQGINELRSALSTVGMQERELLAIRQKTANVTAKQSAATTQEAAALREAEVSLKSLNVELNLKAKMDAEVAKSSTSYNAYKAQVKLLTEEFHRLSEAERNNPTLGGETAMRILELNAKIRELDATLKPYITSQNMLAKIQSEIAYRRSPEFRQQQEAIASAKAELEGLIQAEIESNKRLSEEEVILRRIKEAEDELANAKVAHVAREIANLEEIRNKRAAIENELKSLEETAPDESVRNAKARRARERLAKVSKELASVDIELAEAERRLRQAESGTSAEIEEASRKLKQAKNDRDAYNKTLVDGMTPAKEHELRTRRMAKMAELQAKSNSSVAGSYNKLAAEYELLLMRMREMDGQSEENRNEFMRLAKGADELRAQLTKLETDMGTQSLRVKDYRGQWNGLTMSVNQLVREIPSAAYGLNTLIVAWSNNLPIFFEEISNARKENKRLNAEGIKTVSVLKQVGKAFGSWMTILTLAVGVITIYGREIAEFFKKIADGAKGVETTTEALKKMADIAKKSNNSFSSNATALRHASNEWKRLRTEAEKNQWIKDNDALFRQLDVSIRNINDAEKVFVENTDVMLEAFKLRAMYEAGEELAKEHYAESLKQKLEREKALVKIEEKRAEIGRIREKQEEARLRFESARERVSGEASPYLEEAAKRSEQEYDNVVKASKRKIDRLNREINALQGKIDKSQGEAEQALDISSKMQEEYLELLKKNDIELYHRLTGGGRRGRTPTDLEPQVREMEKKIVGAYWDAVADITEDGLEKATTRAEGEQAKALKDMQNALDKMNDWVENKYGKWLTLTPELKARVQAMQDVVSNVMDMLKKKYDRSIEILNLQWQAKYAEQRNQELRTRLEGARMSAEEEYKVRAQIIDNEMEKEIALNKAKAEKEQISEDLIRAKYDRKRQDNTLNLEKRLLSDQKELIDERLKIVQKGSDAELELKLAQLDKEEQIAVIEARLAGKSIEQIATMVEAYKKAKNLMAGEFEESRYVETQKAESAEYNLRRRGESQRRTYALGQERDLLLEQLRLADNGKKELTPEQRRVIDARIREIEKEVDRVWWDWSPESLLSKMGFDEEQISAMKSWKDTMIGYLQEIARAEVELAEASVEAAKKRTDASESALQSEIEARSNGYANNVETSRKEYLLAKENQRKQEKLLREAKEYQDRLDEASQISSLITASTSMIKAFAPMGIPGIALAAGGIAALIGLYASAKSMSRKAASATYGDGGFEIAEGGSHASGHDINLGMRNGRGKNMRIEGGEGVGIIRKKSMNKYGKLVPEVVRSLNEGTFERIYSSAFDRQISDISITGSSTEEIERLLKVIVSRGDTYRQFSPDGTEYVKQGNTTRIIRH